MSTVETAAPSVPRLERASAQVTERRLVPVKWWAAVGALWLALGAYMWGKWLLDGKAKAITAGSDSVPQWMKFTVHGMEILYLLLTIGVVYFLIVRPWRRERKFTFDGMMIVGFFCMWALTDPWATYMQPLYAYSSETVNLGCPQCQIPGGLDPNWSRAYVEPIGLLGLYGAGLTLGVMLGCRYLRTVKERFPRIGKVGLILSLFPLMLVFDMALEIPMQVTGVWSYVNAYPPLTLFAGEYFQYPLYEGVFMYLILAPWVAIRFWKNDKGESVVERGVADLKVSRAGKAAMRQLAVIGMISTVAVLGYHLPFQLVAVHSNDFPEDVLERPYFLHGMCGAGTDQACAGKRVPIPKNKDAAHATPGGRLVAPHGLPDQVPPFDRPRPPGS